MSKLIEILARKIAVCLVEQVKAGEFSLDVFNYQPGDTIIVKSKEHLSDSALVHLEGILRRAFPSEKIIVFENGMDMAIVRKQIAEDLAEGLQEVMR